MLSHVAQEGHILTPGACEYHLVCERECEDDIRPRFYDEKIALEYKGGVFNVTPRTLKAGSKKVKRMARYVTVETRGWRFLLKGKKNKDSVKPQEARTLLHHPRREASPGAGTLGSG